MYTLVVIIALYFYVRLGMWTARKAANRCERKGAKWGVRLAVALVFFLIPTGDEIAGRIYFNHLCETEAGVKVYQTIELPAEYWSEDGTPRFVEPNSFVEMNLLPNIYVWANKKDPMVRSVIKIDKSRWQLVNEITGEVIGEKVSYFRYFGWINRFSPAPNIGESCRDLTSTEEKLFFVKMFKSNKFIGGNTNGKHQ